MDPLITKALLVVLIPLVAIGLIIAIPHILPKAVSPLDPYPWLERGTDSAIDLLWDSNASKFKETPVNASAFWVDDQAKLLWLLLEDPAKYESYIDAIITALHSVWHEGYFPRRWVVIEPKIIKNQTTDAIIENGFLRIMGDITGQNASNPIRIRYYEAAGHSDMAYLGGQMFMVERADKQYYMISYDIVHLRAEQCQNPSFDVYNPAWTVEEMLMPWSFSYPKYWYYSNEPPLGCAYSTRFAQEKDLQLEHYIGLERYLSGSKNWRCSEFSVAPNTTYTWSFRYRGEYYSGGTFKAFLRWFDNNHAFINQDFTEFSASYDTWQWFANAYTSPVNAYYADMLFWAESDTNGNFYFDDVDMWNSTGYCQILNKNLNEADFKAFSTTEYHSRSKDIGRSAKFYSSYDYIEGWMPVNVSVGSFYNFTFFAKSAIPTTNLKWDVFYSDGTYSEITTAITTSSWNLYGIQASQLSAGKTIVAFAIRTGTTGIDTFVDDVAINYKPSNAQVNQSIGYSKDYLDRMQHVETVQTYQDDDVNFTIQFRLTRDQNHIDQNMTFKNRKLYACNVQFIAALDGLSTVTSGEGSQKTSYSTVWIPEIGRRSHETGAYITTLLYPNETYLWNPANSYFVVELKQIPEWAGCYGIAVKCPVSDLLVMQTSNPNQTSPYLHYLTHSYRYSIAGLMSKSLNLELFCFNGYDFTNPGIYLHYLTNLDQYSNVDLSMNYHIGTIVHALARYLEVKGSDPYDMGVKTWDYYRNVFLAHNNGSYLLTTGKMMEASEIYYRKFGDPKYLDFLMDLADYLVNLQIKDGSVRNGTFPMKHVNLAYLDSHCASLQGLKVALAFNTSYLDAYTSGLKAIKYNYQPVGTGKILNPVDYGCVAPNIKRLFVYSNSNYIDDDFFTFKSAYVSKASVDMNQSLSMLGLSRVWRNVGWNDTDLIVYVCESMPGRIYPGTRVDWISTNSETQPYGLVAWIEVARQQRNDYGYYYEFLLNHYAIEQAEISGPSLNVNITGLNGVGTISTFYLKGEKEEVVPQSIQVDSYNVPRVTNLESLYTTTSNCYYYENYSLIVKAFIISDFAHLQISWNPQPFEVWMPILPILGMVGFIFVCIAPIYTIQEIKNERYAEAMLVGFLLFIVGIGLIMAWLWG